MKNKDWYIIKNLDDFINHTRILVYNSFGSSQSQNIDQVTLSIKPEEQQEFDQVLSYDESEIIIKDVLRSQTHKRTNEKRYLINDILLDKIISQLNQRLVSNILRALVNKGLIETTYDPELDDFVFWCEDLENENNK